MKTTILLHPSRTEEGAENKDLYIIDISSESEAKDINCRELWFPGDAYHDAGHAIVGSYLYLIGGRSLKEPSLCCNTIRTVNLEDPVELEIFELPFYCYSNETVVVDELIYIFSWGGSFLSDSSCPDYTHGNDHPGWCYIWDTRNQSGKFLDAPPDLLPERRWVNLCGTLLDNDEQRRVWFISTDTLFVLHHNSIEGNWEKRETLKSFPDPYCYWYSYAVSDERILYLFSTALGGKGILSSYNLVTGDMGFKLEIPSIEKRCWFPDGYCAGSGAFYLDSVHLVALGDGNLCFLDYSAERENNKLCYTRIALVGNETVDLVIEEEKKIEFDVQRGILDFVPSLPLSL